VANSLFIALDHWPAHDLPAPAMPLPAKLKDVLIGRRTARTFSQEPIPASHLSGLLWYGLGGIRARREQEIRSRPLSYLDSYGSAWDIGVMIYAVEGWQSGSYRYDVRGHRLHLVRAGDFREEMVDVLQGLASPRSAAITIGLVANADVYQWRYRHEHALRRLYLESGHVAQMLIVLGAGYELKTLVTPAQRDSDFLDLHGYEAIRHMPIYTLTMGRTRGGTPWWSAPGAETGHSLAEHDGDS
jgi:SagB-type dehydrogenase family enzyme